MVPLAHHQFLSVEVIETFSDSLDEVRSPYRTAEMFGIEEIIDPRGTRPLLCDWVETAYKNLPQNLGIKKRTMRP